MISHRLFEFPEEIKIKQESYSSSLPSVATAGAGASARYYICNYSSGICDPSDEKGDVSASTHAYADEKVCSIQCRINVLTRY